MIRSASRQSQQRRSWDASTALYTLKNHSKEHECSYCLILPNDQAAIDEFVRRGCKVTGPDEHNVTHIRSEVPFGQLVSNAEWQKERSSLLHGILLFFGWKSIPLIAVALALYAKVNITVAWLTFVAFLCLLVAQQQKTRRYRAELFWAGIVMALFALGCWRYP